MNKQKQILILVLILLAAVLVWLLYFRGMGKDEMKATPTPKPVAEEGKYVPKLNNTLETSVTVINPNDAIEDQPTQ